MNIKASTPAQLTKSQKHQQNNMKRKNTMTKINSLNSEAGTTTAGTASAIDQTRLTTAAMIILALDVAQSDSHVAVEKSKFNQDRTGTGTREWSDVSVNCCGGCEHNCRYCFAMFDARRFGRIKDITDWQKMVVKQHLVDAAAKKFGGVVMFPTTHDITPSNLPACLQTLRNLLSNGNEVLIVSKPHIEVVRTLCKELPQYRGQIQFRFTIGSLLPDTCQLWEPGAPPPFERIKALKHAHRLNFRTSVSMEPMLGDNAEMIRLVGIVEPYVTDTIWLGKLNRGVTSRGLTKADAARLDVAK